MSKKTYRFRVKYGYGSGEHISIDAGGQLEKAIYAMTKQTPVQLGDRIIQGKSILSIEPDYHYYTGWYDSYKPSVGDDFKQIDRDCPDFTGVFEQYAQQVRDHISAGSVKLIGTAPVCEVEKVQLVDGSSYAKELLAGKNS